MNTLVSVSTDYTARTKEVSKNDIRVCRKCAEK